MKYVLKLMVTNIIFILLIGGYNLVYAVDRFVDIPVPPNSSGKADFTSEEGEKEAEQYEKNEVLKNEVTNNTIEKSGNNYLKSLIIEGYILEPQFNMQEDEYIVYVPDRSKITSLNVQAESDDIKAMVEGDGNVSITEDTNIISINVIAENGNLKVYTIKIENELENLKDERKSTDIIIVTTSIIAIIIVVGIIKIRNQRKVEKYK